MTDRGVSSESLAAVPSSGCCVAAIDDRLWTATDIGKYWGLSVSATMARLRQADAPEPVIGNRSYRRWRPEDIRGWVPERPEPVHKPRVVSNRVGRKFAQDAVSDIDLRTWRTLGEQSRTRR